MKRVASAWMGLLGPSLFSVSLYRHHCLPFIPFFFSTLLTPQLPRQASWQLQIILWERELQMGALPTQRDGAWNELGGHRALPGWTGHLGYTFRRPGIKGEASYLGAGEEPWWVEGPVPYTWTKVSIIGQMQLSMDAKSRYIRKSGWERKKLQPFTLKSLNCPLLCWICGGGFHTALALQVLIRKYTISSFNSLGAVGAKSMEPCHFSPTLWNHYPVKS